MAPVRGAAAMLALLGARQRLAAALALQSISEPTGVELVAATVPFDDFDEREVAEDPSNEGLNRSRQANPQTDVWKFPSPGPHPTGGWTNRLIIVPHRKFAFCYIEKNACTQFNRLVNTMNGIHNLDLPYWKSGPENRAFKEFFRSSEISRANGWKTAIFLRDPAERFLSAWLSKCVSWEYRGIDCLGVRVPKDQRENVTFKVEAFEKMVETWLPKYFARHGEPGAFNAHYERQSEFCGGRPLTDYDFVGNLEGGAQHVAEQVKTMLSEYAGVNAQETGVWELLDHEFPSTEHAGHSTGAESLLKRFYRNPEIYKKVVDMYKDDYAKLPFKQSQFN